MQSAGTGSEPKAYSRPQTDTVIVWSAAPAFASCTSTGVQGGGTAGDKMPIPHVGWFTHCKDTEGNDFSLFQSAVFRRLFGRRQEIKASLIRDVLYRDLFNLAGNAPCINLLKGMWLDRGKTCDIVVRVGKMVS